MSLHLAASWGSLDSLPITKLGETKEHQVTGPQAQRHFLVGDSRDPGLLPKKGGDVLRPLGSWELRVACRDLPGWLGGCAERACMLGTVTSDHAASAGP